jgi:hypothetical protein
MQTRMLAPVAALAALALAGCGSDAPAGSRAALEQPGTWTVLTYSIADTNLEGFMMDDLDELGTVGGEQNVNLLALVDRSPDYTDQDVLGLPAWSGGKLLDIGADGGEELDDLGDVNTGDPEVLAQFIADGIERYPADHYALVISDHGASWPGVGADESSGNDTLTLAELHSGIADGLAGGGVEKLDLLGFDACLMATYEVASELAPVANRLVASQELEPGHGWDYTAFDVLGDPATTVDELGSALIDGFEAQARLEGTDAEITLSMVDLNRMGEVDAALRSFTDVLVERAEGIGPAVGRTLAETLGFGNSPNPDYDSHMSDLAMFTSEIGVELLFAADAADDVTRAVNDAVLDRVDGQATQGSTGLSIYFPPQVDYFDDDYRELADSAGWIDFLDTYYGRGAQIPSAPELADAQLAFGADGLTITGSFDDVTAENLADSFIRYGLVESDGSVTFLGDADAEFEAGTATGTYDLGFLTLDDGEDTSIAYLSLYGDPDEGSVQAEVPLSYYSPDGEAAGDLILSAVIDPETGETISATYYVYDESSETYGEFVPEPDWIVVPEVLNVLEDGTEEWFATSEVGLYADLDSLTYEIAQLPSGTQLYVELVVVDFGGNLASVSGTATVP